MAPSPERHSTSTEKPPAQSAREARFSLYEKCNRLDVRRVREHIDHARGTQLVTSLVHQDAGIARESRGVAGHIHDSTRCMLRKAVNHFVRTVARRIEQQSIQRPELFEQQTRIGP